MFMVSVAGCRGAFGMFRSPLKLPHPPIDLILIGVSLLLALFAGQAALVSPSAHDLWLDALFLGAVLIFLVGMVRVLVRAFSIEHDLEEMSAVSNHRRDETDAAAK
jgi:hypothetical protein